MLDINFIRENVDIVKTAASEKGVNVDIDQLLIVDKNLLDIKRQLQELQEQKNKNAKKIKTLKTQQERDECIGLGREIGQKISKLKPSVDELQQTYNGIMYRVPNIPAIDAPRGESEKDNVVVKKWGDLPQFDFQILDHVDILNKNNWADFENVAKVAGTRSYSLCNKGLLLEWALLRFAMDKLIKEGFKVMSFPSFASESAFMGTGHFPTGRDQVYHIEKDDKLLTGTSEVSMNGLHQGKIINVDDLPLLYGGFSTCFRREAGSAGKDVRGLVRVHQFYKVEQFIFCKNDPEESKIWHNKLLAISEQMLQELEIPYQIVECCTGDMGTGKFRMNDIEAWIPTQNRYRETHSCSTLHTWQARRTNTRYRDQDGNVQFCHTLNNTAIATPRLLVPLIENHQTRDGDVKVPSVLEKYL
ncbi:MAG: serine--tRNA ligase [Bacteriovoracaceae bacterium]|nr:serine--tRNA ligase [Bacteriovoracaceae bacterium]